MCGETEGNEQNIPISQLVGQEVVSLSDLREILGQLTPSGRKIEDTDLWKGIAQKAVTVQTLTPRRTGIGFLQQIEKLLEMQGNSSKPVRERQERVIEVIHDWSKILQWQEADGLYQSLEYLEGEREEMRQNVGRKNVIATIRAVLGGLLNTTFQQLSFSEQQKILTELQRYGLLETLIGDLPQELSVTELHI